jgi:hypothetical protein
MTKIIRMAAMAASHKNRNPGGDERHRGPTDVKAQPTVHNSDRNLKFRR